ncbi:GTP1/OBG family GTP-binding protein [Thermoplasma volcanium GSS1]|uniref:GTP1/OBG family GTP-binding protein n=1 Tax=Thermoplasma volcanium (strain ATCC 51530 / DSM 4299 / JCM 9571 / NBRC 15438 / GSS1) TaxID=273116 RepID=Q97CV0_THEVO|nr:GTP-binding protein [Thermoplasma volcanium]BAB59143.1 GTP1/OBG family GTP-binding protein [Thermoplasma volcanium GSS1]
MSTIEERIKEIEDEIKRTQYNKATEHHIGLLKAKIARLQMEARAHKGGGHYGFSIPKSGDATVALVGFPNVGKSSLLNVLTNSESEVGSYAFTTLKAIPGVMEYKGAEIQILDLPGIIENASYGAGRGREILSTVRSADLIVIVTDVETGGLDKIVKELYNSGIVVNRRRKNIEIKKTTSGGIRVHKPKNVDIDSEYIRQLMKEFKLVNADVYIREQVNEDDIIEAVQKNYVYIPSIVAVNKIDMNGAFDTSPLTRFGEVFKVSAKNRIGIDELREGIYRSLKLLRVYLRNKAGVVDFDKPLILTDGSTVRDVCRKINRSLIDSFRYAIISGKNRPIGEQRVGIDYPLLDEDIVTIISRN